MSADNSRAVGPVAEQFAGASFARTARRLFHATRPKFFPASVLPVLVGTAWGGAMAGRLDIPVFLLALFATVCVHFGANVLNDVGDEAIGTDRRNEQRIYPYTGGSRFIQAGIMSSAAMARLGSALLALAAVAGALLLWLAGPLVLAFGFAGVLLAVLYSLGPLRLSTLGLGEVAVGVGLGVLPVTGAAWLQTGELGADLLLFSLPVSAWVAAILLINEVPDIEADAATGKRTLPVRFGLRGTAGIYVGLHLSALLVTAWLGFAGPLPLLSPVGPLLLFVLALKASRSILRGVDDRAGMTAAIEATLGIHTLGSLWLVGIMAWLAFFGGA